MGRNSKVSNYFGFDTQVGVLGCPAEENGGGKIRLLQKGAFLGASVALIAHPWNTCTTDIPGFLANTRQVSSRTPKILALSINF